MKLLRLSPTIKSTTSAYNQFSLGFKDRIDQTIISLQEVEVDIDPKIKALHGGGSPYNFYREVKRSIRDSHYDVVHIHNGITGILFLLAIFPRHLPLLKRTIFTLHNSWSVFKLRNRLLNIILMFFVSRICTCGRSSQSSLPWLMRALFGHKTQEIINGFDNDRIDRVSKSRGDFNHFNSASRLKIVYVGALVSKKNQLALLKALRQVDVGAEIIFLGEGEDRRRLTEYSSRIETSKVVFCGCVSRDETIAHMLEADVFISLSRGEGLPIAVLEAMYSGCFLVLSDIPPHIEIAPPAERCIYVDIEREAEIIECLEFVAANLEDIQMHRSVAKEYALEKFGLDNMLSDYFKIYNEVNPQ